MTGDRLELDAFLPYLVNVLAARLSQSLAAIYGERFGITIAEWRVVAHLARNGGVSVREIQRRVRMDKVKVSRAVGRLEAAGLVAKKTATADRRLLELALTDEGRRVYGEIVPLALAFEREALAALSPEEERTFRDLLDRLLAAVPDPRDPASEVEDG